MHNGVTNIFLHNGGGHYRFEEVLVMLLEVLVML